MSFGRTAYQVLDAYPRRALAHFAPDLKTGAEPEASLFTEQHAKQRSIREKGSSVPLDTKRPRPDYADRGRFPWIRVWHAFGGLGGTLPELLAVRPGVPMKMFPDLRADRNNWHVWWRKSDLSVAGRLRAELAPGIPAP